MRAFFVSIVGFAFLMLTAGCTENNMIMTVSGPIAPEKMGFTLTHEHIMVDFIGAENTGPHRYDCNVVEAKVLPFLLEAKEAGVQTIMECTPAYLARDPVLFRTLSQKSGLNILTNTGYYGSSNDKFVPKHAFAETDQQLAQRWTDEWLNGIDGTDIRPGFIKIATDAGERLSAIDAKLVSAAALTHLQTGLTIACHTSSANMVFEQIEILKKHGVSPEALIWTHAQNNNPSLQINAATEGVWISLDNVSDDPAVISGTIDSLNNLKNHNLLNRVLISHDAGWYDVENSDSTIFRPYTAVSKTLIPALLKNGFSKKEINILFIENPREAFTISVKEYPQ